MLLCVTLSSCASILNPKYQKVEVQTNAKDAKVYVDDQYAGQGRSVKARLERDLQAKQVKVEREGFKTQYKTHSQVKKSPITLASLPLVIVMPVIPILDIGPKAYNYEKILKVSVNKPLPKRGPDQKHLYLSKASFEIDEHDLKFERIKTGKQDDKKKTKNTVTNTESVKIDYSIFGTTINHFLRENDFADTSKQVLRSKTNTLYLTANIEALTFYENYPRSFARGVPMHVVAQPVVEWTIYDVFQQEKLKKRITRRSDEFAFNYLAPNRSKMSAMTAAMEDAIIVSLLELLDDEAVQALLDQEDEVAPEFPPLALQQPESGPKDIESALQASVTIQHKEGHGSGLIVSQDGYIITNYHVVAGRKEMTAILHDGQQHAVRLVRSNEFADLALLKTETELPAAFALPVQKNYRVGQEVLSIGTPTSVELGQTVSKGIISGLRQHDQLNWLQTDVSTNFGNSGGPLISEQGELLGIVNSKIVGLGVEGIAFAIPAWEVFRLLGVSYGEQANK